MNSTWIVYTNQSNVQDFEYIVLRCGEKRHFTTEKLALLKCARERTNTFLSTLCTFEHNRRIFVGSELLDMSLADIIDCTIPLQEVHIATVIKQVVEGLHYLSISSTALGTPVVYNSLRASNLFEGRNGLVKLATFGRKVFPMSLKNGNHDQDRQDIGAII
ncbi:hypothetical protein BJ878DRAFT_524820 [Calycina marina]|uniref:Protein kinase domain-containing protein n=1 Tax=Calycina marina TaxID=1763456 RepID=A0A9P8CBK1_9HELO|nr:hypothetical protein BJ878DRAFT_524820 [Calycina marina]